MQGFDTDSSASYLLRRRRLASTATKWRRGVGAGPLLLLIPIWSPGEVLRCYHHAAEQGDTHS